MSMNLPIGSEVIPIQRIKDERGYMMKLYNGVPEKKWVQTIINFNSIAATLRGLHGQKEPYEETRLVQCLSGEAFFALIDIRKDSSQYLSVYDITLSDENPSALYVPEGVLVGYLTLKDNTLIHLHSSAPFYPEFAVGIRWNDPFFAIPWPCQPAVVSERDSNLLLFAKQES